MPAKSGLQKATRGTIYVISTCVGSLKIGRAKDAARRIRDLQSASPSRITVLAVKRSDNPEAEELRLHRHFDRFRLHGEWFEDAQEIRNWVSWRAKSDKHLARLAQSAADTIWNKRGSRAPANDPGFEKFLREALIDQNYRVHEI